MSTQAGAHPKVVQEMLGHAQITMTLDLYSHLFPLLQDQEADRLEAIYQKAQRA